MSPGREYPTATAQQGSANLKAGRLEAGFDAKTLKIALKPWKSAVDS
jgi:hypothetical protein